MSLYPHPQSPIHSSPHQHRLDRFSILHILYRGVIVVNLGKKKNSTFSTQANSNIFLKMDRKHNDHH